MLGYVKKSEVLAILQERYDKNYACYQSYSDEIDKIDDEDAKESFKDLGDYHFKAASEDLILMHIIKDKL